MQEVDDPLEEIPLEGAAPQEVLESEVPPPPELKRAAPLREKMACPDVVYIVSSVVTNTKYVIIV